MVAVEGANIRKKDERRPVPAVMFPVSYEPGLCPSSLSFDFCSVARVSESSFRLK